MFKILVILQVRDFEEFDVFEREASKIMAEYHGRIAYAFETLRNEDGSGEEVHIVEFLQEEGFINYKNDPRLQEIGDQRERAITSTVVKIGIHEKSYA